MRNVLKGLARLLATAAVLPAMGSFLLRRAMFGADRALEGSTQAFALVPGSTGVYLRRAFLSMTIAHCDRTAEVHFGTLLSQAGTRIDANVYVGPRCHLGLVHIERDVLLAAGVHVPSGAGTHEITDVDRPIREQPTRRTMVRIGEGTWIGSSAVVMADVGRHCVIGAGSVVTKPLPDYVVAAGVPARVIRSRRPESGSL
jgi:virginiamycin A acetyltransferase